MDFFFGTTEGQSPIYNGYYYHLIQGNYLIIYNILQNNMKASSFYSYLTFRKEFIQFEKNLYKKTQ
jgi:hypothetical protein